MISRRDFVKLSAIVAAVAALPFIPNFESEDNMQLSSILLKMADNKPLTPQEKESLRMMADETQNRNSFIAQNTTPANTLNIPFPFFPVYSEVLATDTASLTIKIPSGYKHILFIGSGRLVSSASYGELIKVQFNGDTGSNYVYAYISGNGAGAAIAYNGSDSADHVRFGSFTGSSAAADSVSSFWAFVQNYGSTSFHKNFNSLSNRETDVLGHNNIEIHTGAWKSNAAIQSVTITPVAGSFAAGSAISIFLIG